MPSINEAGRRQGKVWAYGAAATGAAMSVAANVAHSFVPSQRAGVSDDAWRALALAHPQPGAVILAAFWPCALLLALEVVARVDWPSERRWTAVRWGGMAPVALVAAIVSYQHLAGLARWYGEGAAPIVPVGIDGLMVVSTGALLALAGRSDRIGSGEAVRDEAMHAREAAQAMRPESIGPGSIASDAPLAPIASDARGSAGSDRVESIESGRVEPAPDRVVGPAADEFAWSAPDAGVVQIESHRSAEPVTRSSRATEARQDDVRRIRAALSADPPTLGEPLRVKHVMDQLEIGPAYARAAVEYVKAHGTQEQDDEAEA